MPRKPKDTYRFIPDWMRARSDASKKVWEDRWLRAYYAGEKLGPKGQQFIEKTMGPVIGGGEPPEEDWPDDVYDFEDSEEDTPESS